MSKSIFLLFLSLTSCGLVNASSLYVSASGQFSGSDVAGALVSPNSPFTFRFTVDSNPTPTAGSVTTLGFDVPANAFSYTLNGASVNASPTEVRFNTLSNGGLFDLTFGSGLSAATFSFQGPQAFSGSTASPALLLGTYDVTSFTYSDPNNYDSQTPSRLTASVTSTPEPSSVFLFLSGIVALVAVPFRKSVRAR